MYSMKRQKDMTPEDEALLPRVVGNQYATEEEWRNSSRKKRRSQSRNDAQLRICLVVKIKSDAVKNNIA